MTSSKRPRATVEPVSKVGDLPEDGPLSTPLVREIVSQNPEIVVPRDDGTIDRTAMFLTYLAFMGDINRTAAALMTSAERVKEVADYEGWKAKVQHLLQVKDDLGPDDFLRELNRVVCFVQSVRLRTVIDKALKTLTDKDNFDDLLKQHTKDVTNRSCKTLLELVRAAETVHRMTYTALGDTASQRTLRDGDNRKSGLAVEVLSALASAPDPEAEARRLVPGAEEANPGQTVGSE